MGGSKSSTSSTVTTTTIDNKVGASDNAVAIGSGSSGNTINVQRLDGDLLAGAAEWLSAENDKANERAEIASRQAEKYAADRAYESAQVSRDALRMAENTGYDAQVTARETARDALDFGSDALTANTLVSRDALNFGSDALNSNTLATRDALDFGAVAVGALADDHESARALTANLAGGAYNLAGDVNYNSSRLAERSIDTHENVLADAMELVNANQANVNSLVRSTNETFTAALSRNAGDAPQTVIQDSMRYLLVGGALIAAVLIFKK